MNAYQQGKARARQKAIDYQFDSSNKNVSLDDAVKACEKFERLGRRYGLTKEFRENGVI